MTLSLSSGLEVQVIPLGLWNTRIMSSSTLDTTFPSPATSSPSKTLSPTTATLPLMVILPSSTMRSAALREATPASLMNLLRRVPSDMATTSTDLYIEGAGTSHGDALNADRGHLPPEGESHHDHISLHPHGVPPVVDLFH